MSSKPNEPLNSLLEEKAINHLRQYLPETFFQSIREAKAKNKECWWADGGWHFGQGVRIRNILREVVTDQELPTHNWDDYYIEVIEKAIAYPQPMMIKKT